MLATAHPRLRADLVVSRQQLPDGPVFILKDPALGRFVRLKEIEYFIARQFDGQTALEELRRRAEQRFEVSLSASTLEQFAVKLQTMGLFVPPAGPDSAGTRPSPPARVQGSLLYLRFNLLDPDRLLDRLVPRLRFFFSTAFAWFSLATILIAAGVMISNWQELHRNLWRLYRPETLLLVWVTLQIIVVGHEFAHGLTCKRFGGRVHEIGFMLIYFQPAMYCNVSDAWLFPEKRKRLLVTLAGAWFEVFCWSLATLFWRLTDPATLPNYLALVVAATLGIKTLFNLNPLIKLDGYYLLSDYLELPNLRRNAFDYIGASLRRVFGRRPPNSVRRREARIYWIYGVLAAVYSTWLLGLILSSFGKFLTARYQGWGAALFAGLVLILFRSPLRKAARWMVSLFHNTGGIMAAVKRTLRFAVVPVLAGAALYFIKTDFKVSGEFRILPVHNAEIRAEVDGIIEEIVRDEGDILKEGDLIARLSDRDYRAELEKLKAEIAEKEAKLKMLKAGARAEQIELARTTVTKGEERLKHARTLLEMEKTLHEQKLSSKKDFETAAETAALRASELEESKGTLKLLLAGARPEEIEATEAELRRLDAQQKYLHAQLERLRIVSPIAGVVTTHRLKQRLGNHLAKGELLAEVHQLNLVNAEIAVPEKEISEVHLGQPVTLKARAYLNESFQGKGHFHFAGRDRSHQRPAATQFSGRHPTRKQPPGLPSGDDGKCQDFLRHEAALRNRLSPFDPLHSRRILVLVVIHRETAPPMTTTPALTTSAAAERAADPAIKVGILPLFSTWIYQCDQGPAHLNQRLEQLTTTLRADPRNATRRTNFGGWHYAADIFELKEPIVDEFRHIMEQHVQAFLNYFRTPERKKKDKFVLRGWINVNRAGDFNTLHSHPGCFLSATYYVKVPAPMTGGEIYFRDPRGPAVAMYETPEIDLPWVGTGLGVPITPTTGKLLLFPSWLEHRVEKFDGEGERISIAFNASNP